MKLTAGLVAFLVLCLLYNDQLFMASPNIISLLQSLAPPLAIHFSNIVSMIGNSQLIFVSMIIIYSLKYTRGGVSMFINTCLILNVNSILKSYFKQPRPYWISAEINNLSSKAYSDFGNPSGHTAFFLALADCAVKIFNLRPLFAYSIYLVVWFLTSLTRITLGVHSINQVLISGLITLLIIHLDLPNRLESVKSKILLVVCLFSLPLAIEGLGGNFSKMYYFVNSDIKDKLLSSIADNSHFTCMLNANLIVTYPLLFFNYKDASLSLKNMVISVIAISLLAGAMIVVIPFLKDSQLNEYTKRSLAFLAISFVIFSVERKMIDFSLKTENLNKKKN